MRKILAVIILILLLFIQGVEGEDYISNPSNIPLIEISKLPSPLNASDDSFLNFSIENRYEKDMSNITLTVEVFEYATKDENIPINELSHPPFLGNELIYIHEIQNLANGTQEYIQIPVTSAANTKKGVYFMRTQLAFTYENTSYTMKSKSHFSIEDWASATRAPLSDNEEELYYSGKVSITYLDVDGIIPDSSFCVEDGSESVEGKIITLIIWGIVGVILSILIIAVIILFIKRKYPGLEGKKLRALMIIIFTICLAFSLTVSWVFWEKETSSTKDSDYGFMPDSVYYPMYNTAIYSRYKTTGSILANDLYFAEKISEISGKPFKLNNESERDWVTIMSNYCDDVSSNLIEEYEIEYAIGSKTFPRHFYAYRRTYYSRFFASLHEERYKIYENNYMNIWYVYPE